jgi:hypothetical protein
MDEGSVRRRGLCLHKTKYAREKDPCPRRDSNPQSQQNETPQAYTVERADTGMGFFTTLTRTYFAPFSRFQRQWGWASNLAKSSFQKICFTRCFPLSKM